jgi:beta-phosphoglucomutase-like phosphatase (HAD superfamily)
MRIDAVLYDFDGTMVDTEEKVWSESTKEFLGRRNISFDRDKVKHRLCGKSMKEGAQIMQDMYGFSGTLEALEAERIAIVNELLGEVTYVEGFQKFFESHEGVPSAIATSMQRGFFLKIDVSLGASKLVDHVSCIEDAQNGIDAAKRAGMHTIGLTRVFPDITADFLVDSYAEIDLAKMGFELNRR